MGPGPIRAAVVRIAGVLLVCAALTGCGAFGPDRDGVLRIGLTPDYPPIVYRDDGALLGVEPELGRMAAEALGRRPEFVELAWEELVPSLERGDIDVIMSGMSITPDRAERVLFTEPYMRVGQVGVIRRTDLVRLGAPAAIRRPGARVGYVAGTTGEDLVRTELALAESYAFDEVEAGLRSLRAGRIDFFLHDAPTIWRVTMGPGGEELVGLFRPLTDERLAWAVARDAPELKRRLDAILDEWRAANRIEPVLNRWIPVRVEVGD
jgi:polar amino acid transport system substrate-binding protein